MLMLAYSALLTLALVVSSPWWLLRMATTDRYRDGLAERLGRVPVALLEAARGRRVVWLHAVSVGEVLAATRLISELEARLGPEWIVIVSTTTRTGQALARERFGAARVFYFPLDFRFAVRAYLRSLKPAALILMEGELWPRVLHECRRAGVPVLVVNARVSDRSFARAMKFRSLWSRILRKPTLFLAQSEEDARRLQAMGAQPDAVRAIGNLKYDTRAAQQSPMAERIAAVAAGRPILVAGSTLGASVSDVPSEEESILFAWDKYTQSGARGLLVLAPRHPERFSAVAASLAGRRFVRASTWAASDKRDAAEQPVDIVLLDTIGDLASVYSVAAAAVLGGSFEPSGGHNPLEAAQFGVPVITGPSTDNFRDIYADLAAADAVVLLDSDEPEPFAGHIARLLARGPDARAMGERGRRVFETQQGATLRAVEALLPLVRA